MADVTVPEWMPEGLYDQWLAAYEEAGGVGVVGSGARATEVIRASPEYVSYFPGIKREDGSIRYQNQPEQTYFNNIAAFRRSVEGANMNPDVFEEEYIDLIAGDSSPAEFEQRINTYQARVLDAGALTRNWYAQNAGIAITDEAMLAAMMSSRVDAAIFTKNITMAEIGGQAAMRNYDISSQFSEMLQQQGMKKEDADRFFGSAENLLPVLGALASRHGDPDDDFSLEEFADAAFFNDAAQASRIRRLQAQEDSSFTGLKGADYTLSKSGGVSGLDTL